MSDHMLNKLFIDSFEQHKTLRDADFLNPHLVGPRKNGCSCKDCVTKNSFDDDIFVIIQGHTEHIANILRSYRGYKNIIWVLDDKCSLKHYDALNFKSHISTCVADIGDFGGFGNVNFQTKSTVAGVKYAKSLGAKYCIKIRSDMAFSPLHKFINNMNFDKLGFLYHAVQGFFDYDKPDYSVHQYKKSFIQHYELEDNHNISNDYVCDFCVTGPVDEVIDFFDWEESEVVPSIVELKLLWNYMVRKGHYMDTSKESLFEKFYFFIDMLQEQQIDLVWFKHNYENLTNHKQIRGYLYS